MLKAIRFILAATLASTVVIALILALTSPPVAAKRTPEPAIYTGLVADTAVGGYDPVAYFNTGAPAKGSADIELVHEGVSWRFASEANRDLFKSDPQRYAPQFGGYCAYAVSQGYTAKGDPQAWSIVDGKLYLNYDRSVRKQWEKDATALIKKAEANWPAVLAK